MNKLVLFAFSLFAALAPSASDAVTMKEFYESLTPAQQSVAQAAVMKYHLRFYRANGSEVTSLSDPEAPLLVASLRACDSKVLIDLAANMIPTPAAAADDKLRCLLKHIANGPFVLRVELK